MSFDLHNKSVEATVAGAMTAQYPGVPVQWENVRIDQPTGPWVAVNLLDGPAHQTELGPSTIDRHIGVLQFDVLVPQQTATTVGRQMAEYLGNAFRRQTVFLTDGARVIYRVPEFKTRGIQNGYYCIMVRIAYWRDEARR